MRTCLHALLNSRQQQARHKPARVPSTTRAPAQPSTAQLHSTQVHHQLRNGHTLNMISQSTLVL